MWQYSIGQLRKVDRREKKERGRSNRESVLLCEHRCFARGGMPEKLASLTARNRATVSDSGAAGPNHLLTQASPRRDACELQTVTTANWGLNCSSNRLQSFASPIPSISYNPLRSHIFIVFVATYPHRSWPTPLSNRRRSPMPGKSLLHLPLRHCPQLAINVDHRGHDVR